MEVIVSGKISAYGMYVRKLFDKKKVVSIKKYKPNKYKKHNPTSLPIFIISDLKEIAFLKGAMDSYFKKAIVCTDIISVSYLSISKPHVFVSLNQPKLLWMFEILDATFKLLGNEAVHLLNKENNIVLKYLTSLEDKEQNQW